MVIFQNTHRFELTVEANDDEWVARLQEWVPGRLPLTCHLLRRFDTRAEAIEALRRKWRILCPEAEPLEWRDPVVPAPPPQLHSRRRSTSSSHRRSGSRNL